jgi:AcrR family transcriptional regulator
MSRSNVITKRGQKIVSASASGRRSRGANKASRATITRILECARQVLVSHGYAGFTTRRVAEAANISPGNLAYHFPSKRELLQAVVSHVVAAYSERFQTLLSASPHPQGQELKTLVQWLLTDAVTDEAVRTFREFWAISLHDEVIRGAVDDLYDELMQGVVQLLRRSHPEVAERSIREVVHLLALISEGSIVLYGTRRDRTVPHERIIEIATQVIGMIAPELTQGSAEPE